MLYVDVCCLCVKVFKEKYIPPTLSLSLPPPFLSTSVPRFFPWYIYIFRTVTIKQSLHCFQIRLVVERASSKPSPVSTDRLLQDTGSVLSVLLNKKPAKLTPTKQRRSRNGLEDVCVVYMSIGDEQKDDKREGDDVVYQFPKEDCVLSRLRGSFYTLDHLLADGMDTDTRL